VAQSSGPIAQGTTDERQFTDVMWRDRFGDEAGVLADYDGSAYALTLPSDSDIVTIGSTTQASLATVAGFFHKIAQNSTESITIPAASGSSRTDIIALRYDPTYTGAPGPVRVVRIAGSSSSIPAYDASPPGVEELPLWAITRAVDQNLSQATVQRMFPRLAPAMELSSSSPMPTSSPLGTVLRYGNVDYRREMVGGSPGWVMQAAPRGILHNPILPSTADFSGGSYTTIATVSGLAIPAGRRIRAFVRGRLYHPNEFSFTLRFARTIGASTTFFGEEDWRAGAGPLDANTLTHAATDAPGAGTVTYSLQGKGASPVYFVGSGNSSTTTTREFYVEDIGPTF